MRLSLAEENEIDIPFEAVEERLQSIAEGNNFSTIDEFGRSLQRSGVQLQALRNLFITQAAWQGVEQSLFASSIVIEDSAVDAEFARIQAATGAREFRLYEIVIPGSGDAARARANSVYNRAAGGQNFPLLAAQVSGVPSAARDGDLGWRLRSDLGSRARAALDAVELGAVTLLPKRPGLYPALESGGAGRGLSRLCQSYPGPSAHTPAGLCGAKSERPG